MSETPKFTPGPWYVGAMNDALFVIDQPPRPSTDDPNHDAKTQSIAIPTIKRDTHAYEANAYLIAAAPELYAALKRARDMLQAVAGDIEDGGSLDTLRGKYVMAILGVRDAAYDALAKAEGRK